MMMIYAEENGRMPISLTVPGKVVADIKHQPRPFFLAWTTDHLAHRRKDWHTTKKGSRAGRYQETIVTKGMAKDLASI